MFKIAKNPQFTHSIPVLVPVDNGHEERPLKVRFRVLPIDDVNQHDPRTSEGTEAFLRAVVVRFEDVVDENGELMPSDDTLTSQMLALPYIRIALVKGYYDAVQKVRLGN